jgi:hypothetical protein
MKNNRTSAMLAFILALISTNLAASEPAWKTTLRTALTNHYQITTRNLMGKVKETGTVLLVAQDGIQADVPKFAMKPTVIENGKMTKSGAGGIITGIGARSLKRGERVHLYDLRVNDDGIILIIATVDTVDPVQRGTTKSSVQEAALSFRLEDMPSATSDKIIATIGQWLTTEAESKAAKTVSLGQTTEEVGKILGEPSKIVKLEPKVIYIYSDMKVVFMNGKVTDVQ